MTAENGVTAPLELDAAAHRFVEEFALTWEASNHPRMEGRIIGLLMIVDQPYLSSQQIATLLRASAGAVSGATRRLIEVGFVKRHVVPGDRNHYFRVEDDIWGSFLAGERAYLRRLGQVIEDGFAAAEQADGPRRRLANAQHYMEWLSGYHRKMLTDWQIYRDAHTDTGTPPADGTGEP
ncbi:MAG TPA: MarR family transcriptional regulator [Cellulomonas sp.]